MEKGKASKKCITEKCLAGNIEILQASCNPRNTVSREKPTILGFPHQKRPFKYRFLPAMLDMFIFH